MNEYELMTISKGSLGEESAKKLSKEVEAQISELGGKVEDKDFWGKRKLAYAIRQETEGFYEVLTFKLDKDKIDSLKSKLNLTENLVRYLITAQG